jgi:hypothetical protein
MVGKIKVESTGENGGPLKVYMSMTEDELVKHIAQIDEALKD